MDLDHIWLLAGLVSSLDASRPFFSSCLVTCVAHAFSSFICDLIHSNIFSSITYYFAFAVSSPIGVAIGIVIGATTQGSAADWIFAVSMSLACGVFVYVSVNHLLAKGYRPNNKVHVDEPRFKFLAVLFGVVVIAIVMIWDTCIVSKYGLDYVRFFLFVKKGC